MILTQEPKTWTTYKRALPDGYSVITEKEALAPANKEILTRARQFIDRNVKADMPIGHREFLTIGGRKILFIVEPHYHEPNGKTKPWGWHKGATVFVPRANDYWAFLYDDSSAFGGAVQAATIAKRLKRYAIPAAITVMALVNPPLGMSVGFAAFAAKRLRHKAEFKGVSPSAEAHAAAPVPV